MRRYLLLSLMAATQGQNAVGVARGHQFKQSETMTNFVNSASLLVT